MNTPDTPRGPRVSCSNVLQMLERLPACVRIACMSLLLGGVVGGVYMFRGNPKQGRLEEQIDVLPGPEKLSSSSYAFEYEGSIIEVSVTHSRVVDHAYNEGLDRFVSTEHDRMHVRIVYDNLTAMLLFQDHNLARVLTVIDGVHTGGLHWFTVSNEEAEGVHITSKAPLLSNDQAERIIALAELFRVHPGASQREIEAVFTNPELQVIEDMEAEAP